MSLRIRYSEHILATYVRPISKHFRSMLNYVDVQTELSLT